MASVDDSAGLRSATVAPFALPVADRRALSALIVQFARIVSWMPLFRVQSLALCSRPSLQKAAPAAGMYSKDIRSAQFCGLC